MKRSNYIGVQKIRDDLYQSKILIQGKQYCLGSFRIAEEAARAYDNAVFYTKHFMMRNRRMNFPGEYEGETMPARLVDVERIAAHLQPLSEIPIKLNAPERLTLIENRLDILEQSVEKLTACKTV